MILVAFNQTVCCSSFVKLSSSAEESSKRNLLSAHLPPICIATMQTGKLYSQKLSANLIRLSLRFRFRGLLEQEHFCQARRV